MRASKFEIADYLDSKEMIVVYLNSVLEKGDNQEIITTIRNMAKAIGMNTITEETGF